MPFEAPKIAYILPEVRDQILNGKYQESLKLSLESAAKAGIPTGLGDHRLIPAFKL